MELWTAYDFRSQQCGNFHIGPLEMWVSYTGNEWQIAHRYTDDLDAEKINMSACMPSDTPGFQYSRWIVEDETAVIHLLPTMPDRPVVVRPEHTLGIRPACSGTFYVRIPVWVRVALGSSSGAALCTIPSIVLSNTWHGVPTDGLLCYSLKTTARRSRDAIQYQAFRALCMIRVTNEADATLDIERLCVHVDSLSLYLDSNGHLFTTSVTVNYHGEDEEAQIGYTEPAHDEDQRLVGPSNQPAQDRIQRLFARFRGGRGWQ